MEPTPFMQAFQDLYDECVAFFFNYFAYEHKFKELFEEKHGFFPKDEAKIQISDYSEVDRLAREKHIEKFEVCVKKILSDFKTVKSAVEENVLSEDEIEFANSNFEIIVMEITDFAFLSNLNKQQFIEEDNARFENYLDKLCPALLDFNNAAKNLNEKRTGKKLMTFEEASEKIELESRRGRTPAQCPPMQ
jgi:hypothetical protein